MHFARAADADVRWARWHCQPGVVVDEDASTVERDFLPSVPGAQHGQALGIERVVRHLRLHVAGLRCRYRAAGLRQDSDRRHLPSHGSYGESSAHPSPFFNQPPETAPASPENCTRDLDQLPRHLIVITRMRSHAYKRFTMIRSRHATKGFSARARFGAAVTQLRNT